MSGNSSVLWVTIPLLVIGGIVLLLTRPREKRSGTPSFSSEYVQTGLFSACEASFFRVLELATETRWRVFAKVRLADLIRPARGNSRSGRQAALNRIASKHVDFVLCDPGSLRVVGVVELDDKSHGTLERGIRDMNVDQALAGAGVRVLRVKAKHGYSPAELRSQISKAFDDTPESDRAAIAQLA